VVVQGNRRGIYRPLASLPAARGESAELVLLACQDCQSYSSLPTGWHPGKSSAAPFR